MSACFRAGLPFNLDSWDGYPQERAWARTKTTAYLARERGAATVFSGIVHTIAVRNWPA